MSEYSMVNDNLLSTKVDVGDKDVINFLHQLVWALERMKGREYRTNDYKFKLGVKIVEEVCMYDVFKVDALNEPLYIYGIEVEIDYKNVTNIQIFEDITNKIALDH
jgi:hypothetical protein